MSPNEFTECLQVKEHKTFMTRAGDPFHINFTRLWERKVAKYFRTVFQYLFHHGEFTKVQTVLPKFLNCQNIVLKNQHLLKQ